MDRIHPQEPDENIKGRVMVATTDSVLRLAGQVRLAARTEPFDPRCLETRMRMSVDFRNLILSAARPMDTAPETTLVPFDVVRATDDAEIRAKLPKKHVFEDTSVFCAYLEGMISRQPNGEPGDSLVNIYANIFYVFVSGEGYVVYVSWLPDLQLWYVCTFRLGDCQWYNGYRVFSCNC